MSRFCRHPYFTTFAQDQRDDAREERQIADAKFAEALKRQERITQAIKSGARVLKAAA
jgi:hypothetical protein